MQEEEQDVVRLAESAGVMDYPDKEGNQEEHRDPQ
jgi:hypothetical protein